MDKHTIGEVSLLICSGWPDKVSFASGRLVGKGEDSLKLETNNSRKTIAKGLST